MVDYCRALLSLLVICDFSKKSSGTIDLNLQELEYLAAHLRAKECRLLVAALHFDSYELPKQLREAGEALFELRTSEVESIIWLAFGSEAAISKKIPCLRQLLHWNSSPGEGAGKTHQHLEHRLRQIGRRDLADWLGRTTFRELGKDVLRAVNDSFGQLVPTEETTSSPLASSYVSYEPITTGKSVETNSSSGGGGGGDGDGDLYLLLVIDMIVVGLVAGSLFSLVFVVGSLVIGRVARCDDRHQRRNDPNDRSLIDRDCEAADCRDDENDASDDCDTSFDIDDRMKLLRK
uniref:Death domain-containing protein n=1 Tax=Trichogramma kaykai TaxID=54128 RepID=A0ABD2X9V8_9HYME